MRFEQLYFIGQLDWNPYDSRLVQYEEQIRLNTLWGTTFYIYTFGGLFSVIFTVRQHQEENNLISIVVQDTFLGWVICICQIKQNNLKYIRIEF